MKDLNERMGDGTLPDSVFDGDTISAEVPHIVTACDMLADSFKRATSTVKCEFGTFGHYKIDDATGGLRPGAVTLIGADSSFGKSSWAVMIADDNLRQGKRVLIVSAEDPESTYADRLMRRRARIPGIAQFHRRLTAAHYDAMAAVVERAMPDPLFIDASEWKLEKLLAAVRQAIIEHDIQVVIFDYLQVFCSVMSHKDTRARIEHLFTEIRKLVRHVKPGGIAGVVMSQLTEPTAGKPPDKYSVRESKSLTHGSEIVMIGHVPKETSEIWEPGDRMLMFAKIKEGDGAKVGSYLKMNWNPTIACFDPTPEPEDKLGGFYDNERAYTQTPGEDLIERSLFGYRDD